MSYNPGQDAGGSRPVIRPRRRTPAGTRSATGGAVQSIAARPMREVASVGRCADRHYCPACGRKRHACKCGA